MLRSLRTLLVALVATLAATLVFPSIAEAKPHAPKTGKHVVTKTKVKKKTATTTKRVVKHPWKKSRTAPAAKPRPRRG